MTVKKRPFISKEKSRKQQFENIWSTDLDAAFSTISNYYDQANTVASLGLWDRWRRSFIKSVDVKPGQRVLDVCAGTDAIGLGLLKKEPALDIFSVDRSEAMQQVGKRRTKKQGFDIHHITADVHELPFPDGYFDVVTLEAASRHLRLIDVFSEIARVLKPGGRFYHCDMLKPKNKVLEEAYCTYLNISLLAAGKLFRSAEDVWNCRDYFIRAIREFYSSEELAELLAHVGFRRVSYRNILGGIVAFHQCAKG